MLMHATVSVTLKHHQKGVMPIPEGRPPLKKKKMSAKKEQKKTGKALRTGFRHIVQKSPNFPAHLRLTNQTQSGRTYQESQKGKKTTEKKKTRIGQRASVPRTIQQNST